VTPDRIIKAENIAEGHAASRLGEDLDGKVDIEVPKVGLIRTGSKTAERRSTS
jgi:chemotaxis protein CheY-P-specific phosphatase CheC